MKNKRSFHKAHDQYMTIKEISNRLNARIITGEQYADREVKCGFASDLMSDVLTLDTEGLLLITGLANIQTIRTAEMADISCILFVRAKKTTPTMISIAKENNIVLLECQYSMYKAIGILNNMGLPPVY